MLSRLRRIAVVFFFVACSAIWSFAQNPTAEVKRKVYLRDGPSMTEKKGTLLQPGDELQVLEPQSNNDFYHVQTEDGAEGWVAARNISIKQQPPEVASSTGAPVAGGAAPVDAIDKTWEKPDPQKTTFKGVTKT